MEVVEEKVEVEVYIDTQDNRESLEDDHVHNRAYT